MAETSKTTGIGFNKPSQKEEIKNSDTAEVVAGGNNSPATTEEDLEQEYTDMRSVTISLIKNYSLYRRVNEKVIPRRTDYIGSSITSSRILSSNRREVETYFPALIGLAVNNENFVTRVKQYFNNIRIPVDELGKTFDISFVYYKKKDYLHIVEEEQKIEDAYSKVNRQDLKAIKEALKLKITKLNALESSKCVLGYPVNLEDYLMYRHCLLYRDVAKDSAIINSSPEVRFYFKDDKKEAEKARKFREQVNRAKANYVSCIADDTLFNAVYIQYCVLNNLPILSSLAEPRLERELKLDKFSQDDPLRFNKIFANKDVKLMAQIELLIARGELVRSQYNQNITTPDGDLVGANMLETIAWFKNPENSSFVNALYAKLKNI